MPSPDQRPAPPRPRAPLAACRLCRLHGVRMQCSGEAGRGVAGGLRSASRGHRPDPAWPSLAQRGPNRSAPAPGQDVSAFKAGWAAMRRDALRCAAGCKVSPAPSRPQPAQHRPGGHNRCNWQTTSRSEWWPAGGRDA